MASNRLSSISDESALVLHSLSAKKTLAFLCSEHGYQSSNGFNLSFQHIGRVFSRVAFTQRRENIGVLML